PRWRRPPPPATPRSRRPASGAAPPMPNAVPAGAHRRTRRSRERPTWGSQQKRLSSGRRKLLRQIAISPAQEKRPHGRQKGRGPADRSAGPLRMSGGYRLEGQANRNADIGDGGVEAGATDLAFVV